MPSPRRESALAYDAQSDRVILFGGVMETETDVIHLDDTWAYDLEANTWTKMNPATKPSARIGHAMAYDSQSDRVILFGGFTGSGPSGGGPSDASNETWAYDFDTNTWTDMKPAVAPSAKLWPGMAYDSQSDRVVLFGGSVFSGESLITTSETWSYDLDTNTWTKMNSATKPPPRSYPVMAYDSQSDRVILFGGVAVTETEFRVFEDTWSYDVGTDSWTNLSAATGPSTGCCGDGMVYDSQSDRVILYLWNGDGQTWAFDYDAAALVPSGGLDAYVLGIVATALIVALAVGAWYFRRGRKPSSAPPPPPTPPEEEHRP